MPQYLLVEKIPDILKDLQHQRRSQHVTVRGSELPLFQTKQWQMANCERLREPAEDAAILSYRWRTRGANENLEDFRSWLQDCRVLGYRADDLAVGPRSVDWSLSDDVDLGIEVAAWLLWLYTRKKAKYAWLDQMCIPQDIDDEKKMTYIRESAAIYEAGKVYVILAPVLDEDGCIMRLDKARELANWSAEWVAKVQPEHGDNRLATALAALMVNISYFRRVWTIHEAIMAGQLHVWPFLPTNNGTTGEQFRLRELWLHQPGQILEGYRSYWTRHCGPEYFAWDDEVVQTFYDGDYTRLLGKLQEGSSKAFTYLALAATGMGSALMERVQLIESFSFTKDKDPLYGRSWRAWLVLNSRQVLNARCAVPDDRVLALVPLVDYKGWKKMIRSVPKNEWVQASVSWAYGLMNWQPWRWSLRCYHHPGCSVRGLGLLQPRRNYTDRNSVYSKLPVQVEVAAPGGKLVLLNPATAVNQHATAGRAPLGLEERMGVGSGGDAVEEFAVDAAFIVPHFGRARRLYMSRVPWAQVNTCYHFRDDLGNPIYVKWRFPFNIDPLLGTALVDCLEPWCALEGMDAEHCGAVILRKGDVASLVLLALPQGDKRPSKGEVMAVVEYTPSLQMMEELDKIKIQDITWSVTVSSTGRTLSR